MLVSGVLMLSPLLDGRFLFGADDDPVSAALQLPSLAAAEFERKGTFTPEKLAEAERFAMSDYLVSLAGPPPSGAEADAFYQKVSELTGIPKNAVAQARGFVSGLYGKQSGGEGRIVSPYDAAHTAADAYPGSTSNRNDDPVLDGYTRAYGAAFASYARNELGFDSQMTYSLLNTDVNRRWDWGNGGRASASASGNILDLLSVIPSFRVLILHGYSDALTPYGPSRYVIDHLPASLSKDRAELKVYRGGHMFYTDPQSRRAVTDDARRFYQGAARTD